MNQVINNAINAALRHARRVIISVVGFTILILGLTMIVLPGPAIIVIPLGLVILAGEFVWAKRLLDRVKSGVKSARDSLYKKEESI